MKRALEALAALVLLSLALSMASPARAESGSEPPPAAAADFAASKGMSNEERLEQSLRARVRRLPGHTEYLIGGFVQLDAIATLLRQDDAEQDTFFVSSIPFEPADATYRLSLRQSQINWISRTKVGLGHVWARVEANLFPLDGSTALTLNQAVLRWEEYIVFGRTFSTFMDDEALPTTLDYNGPSGVTYVRQWLGRVGAPLGNGVTLDFAVEDADADHARTDAALQLRSRAARPDLTARVRYDSERVHLQLSGLWRRIEASAEGPERAITRHETGLGASLSGRFTLFDADSLLFQAVTGTGVGRYFNDPLSSSGLARGPGGRATLVRTSGLTLYYQRQWADDWMSVLGVSTLWVNTRGERPADASRRSIYASLNLLWRVTPMFIAGVEGLFGHLTRVGGDSAFNLRGQLSVRYMIF